MKSRVAPSTDAEAERGFANPGQAAARRLRSGGRSTGSATREIGRVDARTRVSRRGPRSLPSRSRRIATAPQDRVGHRAEVPERLVGVLAYLEVDLGDRVESGLRVGVDQQADVDAVAGGERQALEQLTPGGDLARERLANGGQLRVEQVQ